MQRGDLKSILYITGATIFTVYMGSAFFYFFELGKNSDVKSFFDAVWWAVVTITSLGYGDIYPVTTGGRIVAIFLMFFGVVLIGAIAGSVSRHYLERLKKRSSDSL